MILTAALTGLRQGELFALHDRDLDLDNAELRVEYTADNAKIQRPKTSASRRSVGLCGRAIAALREQLLARRPNDLGLVFPSPKGHVFNDDNFRARIFREAVLAAVTDEDDPQPELDGVRFHDLRHTYASLMIAAGAHTKLVQEQLGHTSPRITLEVYGHLYPGSYTDVGKHLDAMFDGASQEAEQQ